MRSVQGSRVCARLRWLAAAFLLLACVSPAHAQVPAGYSEYYIPGDEDNLSLALCTHGSTAACTSTDTHSGDQRDGLGRHHGRLLRPLGERLQLRPREPDDGGRDLQPQHRAAHGLRERHHHSPANRDAPRGLDLHEAPQRRRGHDHPQPGLRLLRRPRPHLHGRRPRHRRARGVEPGERRGRPGSGVGDLPGQAAAHDLHLPLRREHPVGRDRHLVRLPAGGRAHPGDRGQHGHHDRRERRRRPRPHQRQPQRDQEPGRRGHHHGHAEQGSDLPAGPGQRVPAHHQLHDHPGHLEHRHRDPGHEHPAGQVHHGPDRT